MVFTKMHGIGNDFVMVDVIRDGLPDVDPTALARAVNDRRFGIGGDGLIFVERGEDAPFRMRMFNPDGSESEMCGNGVRCFAQLVRDHGHSAAPQVAVETGAGELILEILADGRVRVDMGPARLTRGEIGMTGAPADCFIDQSAGGFVGTAVSMGNPHLVVFVPDVESVDLSEVGPRLEASDLFPNRVNAHFATIVAQGEIRQRTWERGAGATLACGTGACAVGVAAYVTGRTGRHNLIHLPGGDLEIDYQENGRVLMTGPAATVFEGDWPLDG